MRTSLVYLSALVSEIVARPGGGINRGAAATANSLARFPGNELAETLRGHHRVHKRDTRRLGFAKRIVLAVKKFG